jgi:2-succinyl-5-enolpyruvyl-6-hydroxy-3-cyclohexene-1-carboxylate synthase
VNPSTALARVMIDELVRGGVRDAVLAPGSRSAPLAFALHAADAAGRLRLHVRVDERSAGFLALGLARTSGAPVAVVTTSGTAVGNLMPAVMEAHHAGLPVVVLSADRPGGLRATGANQTTDQVKLFGVFVRMSSDVGAAARDPGQVGYWRRLVSQSLIAATGTRAGDPGPVHLNLQLIEPLVPDGDDAWPEPLDGRAGGLPWTIAEAGSAPAPTILPAGPRTVVVAGDDAGQAARMLAESAGWPLFAEPTSGARTGTHALRCYRLLLAAGGADDIERVVVFGHPTLSRPVAQLLAKPDVEVVVVAPRGRTWPDAGQTAARVVPAASAQLADDPGWLDAWLQADQLAAKAVDEVVGTGLSPYSVAATVHAALPPRGLLIVGSSNPVRDLDLMASPPPVGERRKIIGNRGLAGIDGTVSTAVGAALGRPASSRSLAYMGDLTFLHDANGLLLGPEEPRPDLTVVVANDDGGSIFALLEQGGAEHAGVFERVFGTPTRADLAGICAATHTPYQRVTSLADLRDALAQPAGGINLIDVPIDRTRRRDLQARLHEAVATAQERSSE